jgi:hypothetical protein
VATDDDRQAAEATEFQKKLDAMVTATDDVKKRYDTGRARVLAATTLLEEECVTTILTKEACTTAALIKPPSPTPPRPPPVVLFHWTMTMRLPSSPTSMSRPPACRTFVL